MELAIANKELLFQNEEKSKRAAELIIANKELVFQTKEKSKRANELFLANNQLFLQNEEKEKRVKELIIANNELFFQNQEKEKRAAELVILNHQLAIQANLIQAGEVREKQATLNKESLDQLRVITGQVPGVVFRFRLNPDGSSCFPYASEAIVQILRVTPDEVREDSAPVFRNIHPDDYLEMFKRMQNSAKNLTPWQNEFRMIFEDGTAHIFYSDAVPRREANGSVLWHGFVTDISQRRLVEEKLHQLEKRYRTLVESASVGIVVFQENSFKFVNSKSAEFSGYAEQELLDIQPLELVHNDDKEIITTNIAKRLGDELPETSFELRILKKDQSICWVSLNVVNIDWEGKAATLNFLTDITERKSAQEKLKEVSIRLKLATRSGGVGSWDYDTLLHTFQWDDQMFKIYYLEKQRFSGGYNSWLALIHPEDCVRVNTEFEMALMGQMEFETIFRVICPDDSCRLIQALGVVQRDNKGKPLRITGTSREI